MNPEDRLPAHEINYKFSSTDRWGGVLNSHTYKSQGNLHGYDDHSYASVADIDLRNLDVWNQFVGCLDGVDACIKLTYYWDRKVPWKELYAWLDTEVFKLSAKTTADTTVI